MLNSEADWYSENEAIDLVRHVGKCINEGTPLSNQDIAEMIVQLRGAIDKICQQEAVMKEWGLSLDATPPIKITSKQIESLHMRATDLITVTADFPKQGIKHKLSSKVGKDMVVNSISIYSFTDALGHNSAVMGVFGDSKP